MIKPVQGASRDPRREPHGGTVGDLQASAEQAAPAAVPGQPGDAAEPALGYVPPVIDLPRTAAARLLPARYSDSVLTRIASLEADLPTIYALDNVTNERLMTEGGGRLGVSADELVYEGPYARIINAAFCHPHPLGARFSTPFRGAWYAGFELATAKAEVLFHRALQFEEIGWNHPETLDYDHYAAEFFGPFSDLRPEPALKADAAARLACLDPASYVASQGLAGRLRGLAAQGIVYPSARRAGGTCLACFHPKGVHSVRKRELHRLSWYPDAPATFRRVPRA